MTDLVRRPARLAVARLRASDPGQGRLLAAVSIVVCVATVLPWQLALGSLLGYPEADRASVALFGGVVATLASNALDTGDRRRKVRDALAFPVAVACGLLPAAVLDSTLVGQVASFGTAIFVAVWVRRFGQRFFYLGFMGFMSLFFATFLQVGLDVVPELMLSAVVSVLWVLALRTTVFQANPARVLRATTAAVFAGGREVAREAADLLAVPPGAVRRHARASRTLRDHRAAVSETTLLGEAWAQEPGAVPEGWSAAALRRRMIETQQALDRLTSGTFALADPLAGSLARAPESPGTASLREEAREVLRHVAAQRDAAVLIAADHLERRAEQAREDGVEGWRAARRVALGARELVVFAAAGDEPPTVDPGEQEFEATAGLVLGGLPGSPVVSRDVAPRGRWNPAGRLSLTTRQAIQAAVAGLAAIALGLQLSPTRWYWAVITAFVVFTGTSSRAETFRKGSARVTGTLVGIVVAIGLAQLTVDQGLVAVAVLLVALFGAFYLAKVTQLGTTLCITVLLGQLYVVLGSFDGGLLVLRLGETVVGAVTGAAVALLFTPLSARDTVRAARDELLGDVARLLTDAATLVEDARSGRRGPTTTRVDLDAAVAGLDDRLRRLLLVARPISRSLVGGLPPRVRRRLALYSAAVSQCRATAMSVQLRPSVPEPALAAALGALAEAARDLRGVPVATPSSAAVAALDRAEDLLGGLEHDPLGEHLRHLGATLRQLATDDTGSG